MQLDLLRERIQLQILETKEYADYLESNFQPGVEEFEKLEFFNLGYQFALKHILSLIDGNAT